MIEMKQDTHEHFFMSTLATVTTHPAVIAEHPLDTADHDDRTRNHVTYVFRCGDRNTRVLTALVVQLKRLFVVMQHFVQTNIRDVNRKKSFF